MTTAARRLVAVGSAGLAVTYELFVLTRPGRLLDDAVMFRSVAWLERSAEWSAAAARVLGAVSVVSCVAVALLVAVAATRAGRARQAVLSLVTAVGVAAGAQLLKATLVRPGSELTGVANSLPSGHVAAVAGLAAGALVATAPRWRRWVLVAVTPAVTAVGLAVVAEGWHRPSDVLAACFLAVAACGCALHVSAPWEHPDSSPIRGAQVQEPRIRHEWSENSPSRT